MDRASLFITAQSLLVSLSDIQSQNGSKSKLEAALAEATLPPAWDLSGATPPPGTPAGDLLSQLNIAEKHVQQHICRALLADTVLPWTRKLHLVARCAARFGSLRARLIDVASKAALALAAKANADADAAAAAAAEAAAAEPQDASAAADAYAHPRKAPLPRRASAPQPRAPRRKAAIFSERASARATAAGSDDEAYTPDEEAGCDGETPLGSAASQVLRTWLADHFLHPYPTLEEKMNLAMATTLRPGQVSNWLINARVRIWRPSILALSAEIQKEQETASAQAE